MNFRFARLAQVLAAIGVPQLGAQSIWNGGGVGNIAGFTNGGGGTFSISGTTNDLVLNFTSVPEPSTWAMIAAGAFTMAAFGMRRRVSVRL